MKSIVGVSIHANFIISFLVLFMFAMGMHVGGYAGVFVVLLFAANLLSSLFLVAFSLHKDMLRVPSNFYYPAVLSCLAIFYFSVWIFGGLSAGQHVKDALGGSLKAMLPFIVFISFSMAFNRVSDKYGIYRFALVLMVFYGFVYAVGKIVLLSLGYFYGAGLSQYIVSSFVLALFFSAMVYKVKVRLSWFLLFLFLFLSVLSFKRTVWVQLLVAFFVFLYFFPKAKKLQLIFSAALGLAVAVTFFADSSLGDRIVSRFLYTFSGDSGGLDSSSGWRVLEIKGMLSHYFGNYPVLTFWVGHGPGAGFDLSFLSVENKNTNEFGEAYHIHSFWGIVFFRFGVIGLLLYFAAFIFSLIKSYKAVVYLIARSRSGNQVLFWCLVGAMASFIELLMMLVATISANSFYASYLFGFVIFVVCAVSFIISSQETRNV